jgi:hypothetical protein
MALYEALKVAGAHVNDRSLVNVSVGDVASGDEVSEVLRGIRINLVVIDGHRASSVPAEDGASACGLVGQAGSASLR